jgi:penicillin amidase
LHSALDAALEELRARLGDDPTRWQYGKIHKMTYGHVLGAIKPLNTIFNRGPYPVGGDIDTVNLGAAHPTQPENVMTVPSFRLIANLANLAASLSIHAPGQSGQPSSKHYDDFIKPWRNVEYHPMLFDRTTIEEQAEGTLRIIP